MQTLREYSEKISDMWLYELNGTDTPDTVTAGSAKTFWWKCLKNPKHVFQKRNAYRMYLLRSRTSPAISRRNRFIFRLSKSKNDVGL